MDGRTGDLGQWMSAPCCALLQELLCLGRVIAVGKITYRRFRRQSFVSAGALCVGPAHLSACAFYLLKDGKAAALLKYPQPEHCLAELCCPHIKTTVARGVVSDKAHGFSLFVPLMMLNPPVIKLSKSPDFTPLCACSVFPLHPAVLLLLQRT